MNSMRDLVSETIDCNYRIYSHVRETLRIKTKITNVQLRVLYLQAKQT